MIMCIQQVQYNCNSTTCMLNAMRIETLLEPVPKSITLPYAEAVIGKVKCMPKNIGEERNDIKKRP